MHGKLLHTVLIITLIALPLHVAIAGNHAVDFLNIDVSALQASYGGAGSALSSDITASYYNPAGLSIVDRSGISFMHNLWYQDISYEFLGGAFALNDKSTLALSSAYLHMGDIVTYDISNQRDGSITAYSMVGIASYSYKLSSRLSLGFSGKYITEKLDDIEASSYAVDIGAQYHLDNISFGAVVNNLGPKIKYEVESFDLPTSVSFGSAYEPFQIPAKLIVGVEVPFDGNASFSTAAEYRFVDFLSLRSGIGGMGDDRVSGAFNVGAGFNMAGIDVDYAFNPGGDLGQTHFFSFSFSFGGGRGVSMAKPKPIQFSQKKPSKAKKQPKDIAAKVEETKMYVLVAGKFDSEQIAGFHINTLKEFGVSSTPEKQSDGKIRIILSKTENQAEAKKLYDEYHSKGIAVVMETE